MQFACNSVWHLIGRRLSVTGDSGASMRSWEPNPRIQSVRSGLVIVAAALTLSAQLLAESPLHRDAYSGFGAPTEISSDTGPCPLCILAFHSPANPGLPPAITDTPPATARPILTGSYIRDSLFLASCYGRAPPALV